MATHDAAEAMPPPLQDIPTAKEKKYDRQLRLWGASGQIALEETHVLLVNNGSGVAGVETLKNLVLPGLGQFTILDSNVVTKADLGINFFLEDSSLGKFRASETVKYLVELNPAVRGYALAEPVETFITRENAIFEYTLIIVAAPIDPNVLALFQDQARALHIPLFYLHSIGFFSTFSISLPPAFPIVETHPDPDTTTDLRLLSPWPALIEFANQKTNGNNISALSQHEKGHVPWICLLLYYLNEWRQQHDGQNPSTYKQKSEFREMVRAGDANEENYDEACANVLKSLNPPTVSSAVREILNAPEANAIDATSPSFWLIANAVRQFWEQNGELPLPGSVPDMKAQSADYIQLQNIYKTKARQDFATVLSLVRQTEQSVGRAQELAVDEKEVENFCKGAAHIHLVRGRPFPIVYAGMEVDFRDRAKALTADLTNPESLIGLYISLLAWDEFAASHTTSPSSQGGEGLRVAGAVDTDVESDGDKLTGIAHKFTDNLIKQAGTTIEEPEYSQVKGAISNICVELVRAGGGELHNISSLTGGLLAQEVIKVITRQYVPVDNTCLFDGVASKSYVLRL